MYYKTPNNIFKLNMFSFSPCKKNVPPPFFDFYKSVP